MQYRPVAKVVILTIITLGFYALFWLYWTRRDMVRFGYKIPSILWLIVPGLAFFAFLLLMVAMSAASSDVSGTGSSSVPGAFWVFTLLFGVVVYVFSLFYPLYWFYKYCESAAKITSNRVELATGYVLYIVAWLTGIALPIWMAIMQDAFNKVAAPASGPAVPTRTTTSGPITTKKPTK